MEKKKVIIFGCSGLGKLVQYSLDNNKYEVTGYIDNCEEIWGKDISGIKVISPYDIKNYAFDYIIISLSEYENEMRNQLHSIGVADEKIITFMPNKNEVIWQEPRYAMMKNCAEQIIARNIQGSVAELGVYQGEFASHLNHVFKDRNLYLFDTFEGFNNNDTYADEKILMGMDGFKDTNISTVMEKMKYPNQVVIKKGWFPDTARDIDEEFCFVSLDTDLYKPIMSGLEYFYPRLVKGGYIFVHDFGSYNWSGVRNAVYDYCDKNQISFVPILDKCLSIIITK